MANYVRAAEGLDIYPAGPIVQDYPWYVMNPTYVGSIVPASGAFGGNSMRVNPSPTTQVVGTEYAFSSTSRMRRTDSNPGSSSFLSFSCWIRLNNVSAITTNLNLVSMGTDANTTQHQMMFGLNIAAATGGSLMFPRNITTPTSNPFLYPISTGDWHWVSVTYAWSSGANLYASYMVDGAYLANNIRLTWNTDAFSAAALINRIRFWGISYMDYSIDDIVIQNISNQDSDWAFIGTPQPTMISQIGPRRIYTATATANGSINQWIPSSGDNYQAATDPTGAQYVTADSVGAVDLYKWSLGADTPTDITGVAYRGSSSKYRNIQPAFKTSAGPVVVPGGFVGAGANKYTGFIENDGTTAWTKTSIEAGEFGQST